MAMNMLLRRMKVKEARSTADAPATEHGSLRQASRWKRPRRALRTTASDIVKSTSLCAANPQARDGAVGVVRDAVCSPAYQHGSGVSAEDDAGREADETERPAGHKDETNTSTRRKGTQWTTQTGTSRRPNHTGGNRHDPRQ